MTQPAQPLIELKSSKKDIGLHDAAIVRREGDKVKVKETKDMGGGKGAVIGGVLAGIATGGLSILAGAVGGGLIAKLHDANLSNKDLKALGAALPDGQDAVLAVVDEASGDKVTEMLKQAGAVATTVNLDADTLARLTAPAEEAAAEAPARTLLQRRACSSSRGNTRDRVTGVQTAFRVAYQKRGHDKTPARIQLDQASCLFRRQSRYNGLMCRGVMPQAHTS